MFTFFKKQEKGEARQDTTKTLINESQCLIPFNDDILNKKLFDCTSTDFLYNHPLDADFIKYYKERGIVFRALNMRFRKESGGKHLPTLETKNCSIKDLIAQYNEALSKVINK